VDIARRCYQRNERGAPASGVWEWLAALVHAGIDLGDRHARADLIDPGLWLKSAWAGAAKPRTAAASPLATMLANPNLFIVVPSSFCLLFVFEPWCECRGWTLCRPVVVVACAGLIV
jgi:hypothetical protein